MATQITDRQAKWLNIRHHRNLLLRETDWSQLPDAPIDETEKPRWATYRQNLRDLPQSTSDPDLVVWPNRPA